MTLYAPDVDRFQCMAPSAFEVSDAGCALPSRLDRKCRSCYSIVVGRKTISNLLLLIWISLVSALPGAYAQRERQIPAPDASPYGTRFFDQLRRLFGIFRQSDLQHAFEAAQTIQCSELIVSKGEWRTVAFFNEDRSLGEWCRNNIDEVKSDLAVYTFKGSCTGEQGAVQVTTRFPVAASADAYGEGKISFEDIDVNVNAPVNVFVDPKTQAYTFELPYLFLTGKRSTGNIYSLVAPRVEDTYAPDVTSRWECKSVKSEDVTYRFLICRTATVPRNLAMRNQNRDLAFGASAFFILSDGMEAETSVKLSFGTAAPAKATVPPDDAQPVVSKPRPLLGRAEPTERTAAWQAPDAKTRLTDAVKGEVRLRFNPQTWAGKAGVPEIFTDQKMSPAGSGRPAQGADYCLWSPAGSDRERNLLTNETAWDFLFSAQMFERSAATPVALAVDVQSRDGLHIGTLKCSFPGADKAANVDFERWVSIVGGHIMLEIRK